jgi:hypothetical protein
MRKICLSAGVVFGLLGALLAAPGGAGPVEPQSTLRNIQVLTSMSDREIQQTMQSWTRQFGVTCFECHVQGDFASDALARKVTARRMSGIVETLNQTPYFAEGARKADCFLCHQGSFTIAEAESP